MKRVSLVVALMLVPLIVYWPTVVYEYGFRDDYAHLREVHDVPGWLIRLTSSYGRPVYGYMLETSLSSLKNVADLSALRLAATLLLSATGLLLWGHLRRSGWSDVEAAVIGAAVTLLPGAQVIAGWAIAWPIAFALVAAIAGFTLIDRSLARQGWLRAAGVLAGALLYFVAGLTYQTCALFAVTLLAAGLLTRRDSGMRNDAHWMFTHLSLLFMALFSGWLLTYGLTAYGLVPESTRLSFEPDPLSKLLWFVRNPLPNSLALFPLRDDFATPIQFFVVLAAVALVIMLGLLYGAQESSQRRRWLIATLVLPFVAHSVSLVANSQAVGYRTLLPLSGLFLVLAMFGLRAIITRFQLRGAAEIGIYGGILLSAAGVAQHNAFTLIAEPQGREWQLMQAAVEPLQLHPGRQVFIVLAKSEDRPVARVYADEFGSLSGDTEWVVKEMFHAALREWASAGPPQSTLYTLEAGFVPPASGFDLVVDLRVLKLRADHD